MEGHWGGQLVCHSPYLSQSCHSSDPGHVLSVTDHEQARLCVLNKDNSSRAQLGSHALPSPPPSGWAML